MLEKKKLANAGSERIFNVVTNSFKKHEIPITNILRICFNGCNTMSGSKTGLKARLEKKVLNIICITCPAQKTYLAVKHAMLLLPKGVTILLVKVYQMETRRTTSII